MTVNDIINVLPMNDDLRMEILGSYDSMDDSRKYILTQAMWSVYMKLYNERLNENVELQLHNVVEGKDKLGKDFYARALKKTEQQMSTDFSKSVEDKKLAAARKAMEIIVREIKASKKKK